MLNFSDNRNYNINQIRAFYGLINKSFSVEVLACSNFISVRFDEVPNHVVSS